MCKLVDGAWSIAFRCVVLVYWNVIYPYRPTCKLRVQCRTVQPELTVFADVACQSHQYGCTNGRCIYRDWMCDGVEDCPLGDDELPSLCSKFCTNRNESRLCYRLTTIFICHRWLETRGSSAHQSWFQNEIEN